MFSRNQRARCVTVRKYQEEDYCIAGFGLFMRFVGNNCTTSAALSFQIKRAAYYCTSLFHSAKFICCSPSLGFVPLCSQIEIYENLWFMKSWIHNSNHEMWSLLWFGLGFVCFILEHLFPAFVWLHSSVINDHRYSLSLPWIFLCDSIYQSINYLSTGSRSITGHTHNSLYESTRN